MNNNFEPSEYWERRLSRSLDLRGVGDIGLPVSYNEALYRVRRSVFLRLLRRAALNPQQTSVLDVGSGTGFYLDLWTEYGVANVWGSDLTNAALSQLASTHPTANLIQMDIGKTLPEGLAQMQFDAISCFDVLFHIVDDSAYLKAVENLALLIRPGGWLLYSDNLMKHAVRTEHQVQRPEPLILEALNAHGFKVRQRAPAFVLMNDPVRTKSKVLRRLFSSIYHRASKSESAGRMWGRLLLPLELLLTRYVRNGPSTEVLLCQRV